MLCRLIILLPPQCSLLMAYWMVEDELGWRQYGYEVPTRRNTVHTVFYSTEYCPFPTTAPPTRPDYCRRIIHSSFFLLPLPSVWSRHRRLTPTAPLLQDLDVLEYHVQYLHAKAKKSDHSPTRTRTRTLHPQQPRVIHIPTLFSLYTRTVRVLSPSSYPCQGPTPSRAGNPSPERLAILSYPTAPLILLAWSSPPAKESQGNERQVGAQAFK